MKKAQIKREIDLAARNILSDQEAALITFGAVLAHGGQATRDELRAVLDWATMARMDAAALDMALRGEIVVSAIRGKVAYRLTTEDEREQIAEMQRKVA